MLTKAATNASNVKEGVLRACQVMVSLAREIASGNHVYVGRNRERSAVFLVPELEIARQSHWNWLVPREHAWKKQLWVKGKKLTAFSVWSDIQVNALTRQEAMSNWSLPEAAIDEICAYCEENLALIQAEANEEMLRLRAKGVRLDPAR